MTSRSLTLLWLAFVGLQFADIVSTEYFLNTGRGVEGNPLVALTMSTIGVWWIIPKIIVTLGCAAILVKRPLVLTAMTILYGFVVLSNLML